MRRWLRVGVVLLLSCVAAQASGAEEVAPLDLNWATAEQLQRLPGVGRKRAEAIVEHRRTRPFKRASELMKVRGFGARTFMRLRPHVFVRAPVPAPERPAPAPRIASGAGAGPPSGPAPAPSPSSDAADAQALRAGLDPARPSTREVH